MANPHNPARIGETWNQERIDVQLDELEYFKHIVTLSGGWAWHFISAPNHEECRIFHDHKDIDLFVKPEYFSILVFILKSRNFMKAWTKYDNPSGNFHRYTKKMDSGKIMLDIYIENVPSISVKGYNVVEPEYLLSLYKTTHMSKECVAVKAAQKLISQNINIIDHPALSTK